LKEAKRHLDFFETKPLLEVPFMELENLGPQVNATKQYNEEVLILI